MACYEMCLLLTKHQLGLKLRIAHGRAQYAQMKPEGHTRASPARALPLGVLESPGAIAKSGRARFSNFSFFEVPTLSTR